MLVKYFSACFLNDIRNNYSEFTAPEVDMLASLEVDVTWTGFQLPHLADMTAPEFKNRNQYAKGGKDR
jgi:hypothetical protein